MVSNISDIVLLRRGIKNNTKLVDQTEYFFLSKKANWSLRWDYNGWRESIYSLYTQKDWNQTLITRVNDISAQIHKSTLRGGANTVVIPSKLLPLFQDIEYFNECSMDISSRYQVIISDTLPENKILIYYKSKYNTVDIPLMNGNISVTAGESNILDIPGNSIGVITIDNYTSTIDEYSYVDTNEIKQTRLSKYLLIRI